MSPKAAAAIRHIHFEDLGNLGPVLRDAGFEIDYRDACTSGALDGGLDDVELLVVLGAPIGAYDEAQYPFLCDELALIGRRLERGRPTLGICLGSQLIARALGNRVYPAAEKEIGWADVELTNAGRSGPLRHLEGVRVLHWHGDTFDLPEGCELLASTASCRNQAFSAGPNLLGLQFHVEATGAGFEHWLVGHACELAAARLDPGMLRAEAREAAPLLEQASARLMSEWLQGLA